MAELLVAVVVLLLLPAPLLVVAAVWVTRLAPPALRRLSCAFV